MKTRHEIEEKAREFMGAEPTIPAAGDSVQRLVRRCTECGRSEPGHSVSCRTGNARAKAYQDKLESDYRKSRKPSPNDPAQARRPADGNQADG